jgi:phosphatidylinositol alpha-mannosyltransferase
MAAGTVVVASSLDGYRNVATSGVDSLLVEPGDPDALATALSESLHDHEVSHRLRAAGTARSEEFAMASLTDRYLDIYRSICPSPAG